MERTDWLVSALILRNPLMEQIDQLLKLFGDIQPFLTNKTDLAPITRKKLLGILCDSSKRATLELEMSIVVDAGAPLVRATYQLEGGGPLAQHCFEILNSYPFNTVCLLSDHHSNYTEASRWGWKCFPAVNGLC